MILWMTLLGRSEINFDILPRDPEQYQSEDFQVIHLNYYFKIDD
jgi:hypothetical protein